MRSIDRPYYYRRHVLFVLGVAAAAHNELLFKASLALPFLSSVSLFGAAITIALAAVVAYGTAVFGLRMHGGRELPIALLTRAMLGHASLALLMVDACFALLGSALGWLALGVLLQRWATMSYVALWVGSAVGLYFGAAPTVRAEEHKRRLASGLCAICGYDLTGNTSGQCPECGAPPPETTDTKPVNR